MIRRRRAVLSGRRGALERGAGLVGALARSQAAAVAVTPRDDRIRDLIGLAPGRRYLDVGCGTAPYAHLLARRAGLTEAPVCVDLVADPGPVDAVVWPENLPFADAAFDAFTSLYLIRRLDDDAVHAFAREISRILAPGGAGLILDFAPVRPRWLNRLHQRLLTATGEGSDLRGWARLAALFTECGFSEISLVDAGPYLLPPIPRSAVLVRR